MVGGTDIQQQSPPLARSAEEATTIDTDTAESLQAFEDETLGSDVATDATSLASSILRHRKAWGRTYHSFRGGENDYWAPNDDQQNRALDIGHHMLTLLLDKKLVLAPIDEQHVREVLDVGCGTGSWSIDYADAHPHAQVTGIDLSPIQPSLTPPNCNFLIDDVEDDWMFRDNHFDFIHIRCMTGSIKDWPALYRQAYQRTKPGGWIQHMDMSFMFTSDDGSVAGEHIMRQWGQTLTDGGEQIEKTFLVTDKIVFSMHEAGFEDVEEKRFKLPVGSWPRDKHLKTIGFWNYHYCDQSAEGWALYLLTGVLGRSVESCRAFIARFRDALNDRNNHAYYEVVVVWGRKARA